MRKLLSGISIILLVSLSSSGFGADPLPSDKNPGPAAAGKKALGKSSEVLAKDVVESTPLLYRGRQLLFCSRRPFESQTGTQGDYLYLYVRGAGIGEGEVSTHFGHAHSLGSAFVKGDTLHVFAAEIEKPYGSDWFRNINHFWSTDLQTWNRELAIPRAGGEHLLNSSVCRDEQGYLMAYETDKPVGFCFKFARSKDLSKWEKIPGLVFAGVGGKEYSACPVIRYFKPYYYVIYLHAAIPGHPGHISFMARSKDLAAWQLSPFNPMLEAGEKEGNNNSDVDLIEIDGKTYVYYCTGNQMNWGDLKRAVYEGPMQEFFESHFPAGAAMTEVSAVKAPETNAAPVIDPSAVGESNFKTVSYDDFKNNGAYDDVKWMNTAWTGVPSQTNGVLIVDAVTMGSQGGVRSKMAFGYGYYQFNLSSFSAGSAIFGINDHATRGSSYADNALYLRDDGGGAIYKGGELKVGVPPGWKPDSLPVTYTFVYQPNEMSIYRGTSLVFQEKDSGKIPQNAQMRFEIITYGSGNIGVNSVGYSADGKSATPASK